MTLMTVLSQNVWLMCGFMPCNLIDRGKNPHFPVLEIQKNLTLVLTRGITPPERQERRQNRIERR